MRIMTISEMESLQGGDIDCKEAATAIGMATCALSTAGPIAALIWGPSCGAMIFTYTTCALKD